MPTLARESSFGLPTPHWGLRASVAGNTTDANQFSYCVASASNEEKPRGRSKSWKAALRADCRHERPDIPPKRPVASFLASDCNFSRQSCSFSRAAHKYPDTQSVQSTEKMKILWIVSC